MWLPSEDLLPRIAFLWGGGSSWTVPGMLLFLVCVNGLLAGQLLELGMFSWFPGSQGERADIQDVGRSHRSQPALRARNTEVFFSSTRLSESVNSLVLFSIQSGNAVLACMSHPVAHLHMKYCMCVYFKFMHA